MIYECHITISAAGYVNTAVDAGWKFSRIDGDPVLGDNVYSYLTAHDNDLETMRDRMRHQVERLTRAGVPVLREKIERTEWDRRGDVVTVDVRHPAVLG